MNRLKRMYRRGGIPWGGGAVYLARHRAGWLGKIREAGVRRRAEPLYQQLDMLQHLRQQARRELLAESRQHPITAKLRQIPSLGPIRSALAVGSDPDAASFSYQTPAVGLQPTGVGNSPQRSIPLRRRPNTALQKTDFDARPEQRSQSRSERSIQRRRHQSEYTARTVSGFLPEIIGQRH